eukprot:TRINITY_DN32456_c0_g1_i1.p3 TRINITY_DN32456_c0_g1~~TRINITY_DN32456_c0_g1_i1.p3  ORF type:complete len:124 (-),score=0.97 TRINITY_DN32456_c0_g1_i1:77-448(-)
MRIFLQQLLVLWIFFPFSRTQEHSWEFFVSSDAQDCSPVCNGLFQTPFLSLLDALSAATTLPKNSIVKIHLIGKKIHYVLYNEILQNERRIMDARNLRSFGHRCSLPKCRYLRKQSSIVLQKH